LLELFQLPLKPSDVAAPEARLPFQLALVMVTWLPLCWWVPPQLWLTVWPAVNDHVNCQPVAGSPTLVRLMLAVKPPGHWAVTL
jgi:hypothetical protein